MNYNAINFAEKITKLEGYWKPAIIAELNDYQFKIVKVRGDFVWHSHTDTDEAFIVLEGQLSIELPDGRVNIGPGEMFIVPKGIDHKPFATEEVKMLLVEPTGVVNTGDSKLGSRTADADVWV